MCLNILYCLGGSEVDKDEFPPEKQQPTSRPPKDWSPSPSWQTETQQKPDIGVPYRRKLDTPLDYKAAADQNAQDEPHNPVAGGGLRPGAAGSRPPDGFHPNGKGIPLTDVTETTRSTEQQAQGTCEGSRLKVAHPVIQASVDSGGKRSADKGGQPEAPRAEEFPVSNQTQSGTGRHGRGSRSSATETDEGLSPGKARPPKGSCAEELSTGRKQPKIGDGDDTDSEGSATSIQEKTRHTEDYPASQHDAAHGRNAYEAKVAEEGSAANYGDRGSPLPKRKGLIPTGPRTQTMMAVRER